ncbi:hypothetical protein ACFQE1_04165 [Halobium palmae]|uniref:Uncharacterized protein n=1 Tax=Halobium palmae TaxID=1776492 RepID=A0ABD5RWA5_9EURY
MVGVFLDREQTISPEPKRAREFSDRANVSPEIIDRHYDQRSERERTE